MRIGPSDAATLEETSMTTTTENTRARTGTPLLGPITHVALTVRRGSNTEHLTVTLGTQPTQAASNAG